MQVCDIKQHNEPLKIIRSLAHSNVPMAAPALTFKISWTRVCDPQKSLILLKMKFCHQDIKCTVKRF